MYKYERDVLDRITSRLREKFQDRIVAVYAFGSKVRGDYDDRSDFDILIVVKDRDPDTEHKIIDIFVEEEVRNDLFFSTVIKDYAVFEKEKGMNSPFYQNIAKEGVAF